MKKWLIGSGIVGLLVAILLVGSLATGAFAQGTTPPAPSQATITPEEAKAAALAANPGTTAIEVEMDNESGTSAYEVELDNGLEVQVDANNGAILGTEQEGANEGAGDLDNVQGGAQEESESQADDALETPHAKDAAGQ